MMDVLYLWEQGRQLAGITGNGKTITYKYNDFGTRTQKTVNGVTTTYHLVGDKVTFETNGTDNIYYTYDGSDSLVSMNLNGVEYYYIRNAQGDIIGLHDKDKLEVVSYSYNSWGKLISIKDVSGNDITNDTTHVGYKNPYRYRGYRYDTETSLYYLQSRYYNADWGRFLNADEIVGQMGGLLEHNMFAYCKNNAINMCDPSGNTAIPISPALEGLKIIIAILTFVYTSGYAISLDIGRKMNDIAKSVAQSFSKVTTMPRYKTPTEIHHIVAQMANGAQTSRKILHDVGIRVNDPVNLVAIKTGLHRRLHTTFYYKMVNKIIDDAFDSKLNYEVNRKRVTTALGRIRGFLLAMSGASPF